MADFPVLLQEYMRFCQFRAESKKKHVLDLSKVAVMPPATLLPLADYLTFVKSVDATDSENILVSEYVNVLLGGLIDINRSFVPVVSLPRSRGGEESILQKIYRVQKKDNVCGGDTAFKLVIGELVDNVYEHSEFSKAFVMAQRYDSEKFVELCLFDNGLTIRGSLAKYGKKLDAVPAILAALKGFSTKGNERGYGLGSSVKLVTKALNGQFLIVSGGGAIHIVRNFVTEFQLEGPFCLNGTLVAMRIPFSSNILNVYDYVD